MSRDLREARMSLAQAVTRSLDADTASDAAGRAAADHRAAAALRLRRAGHAQLAQRLSDTVTVTDATARAEMRGRRLVLERTHGHAAARRLSDAVALA